MQTSKEWALTKRVHAPRARSATHAPCHSTALTMTKRRLTMSAMAPAGSVHKKNGAEEAVAMRDKKSGEASRSCINHVAVMSWVETTVPAKRPASHTRQKAGFRSANQVEVELISSRVT